MLEILKKWVRRKTPHVFEGLHHYHRPDLSKGKTVFITGVGRSGTHFMASLFSESNDVAACHMDDIGDAVGDSFTWYNKWYNLPLHQAGFLRSRSYLIDQAQSKSRMYVESNPMLACSIEDLAELHSRFIIMVRNPKSVVESHYNKGWYKHIDDGDKPGIPGYHYHHQRPNHFFSRIRPHEQNEFTSWLFGTRLGKIAWMWGATYERIFDQLAKLPPERYRLVYLDSFRYSQYKELCSFASVKDIRSESDFSRVMKKKPGRAKKFQPVPWNQQAVEEFNSYVKKVIGKFPFSQEEKKNWLL